MLNLIKVYLLKMFKGKSTAILLLISIAFSLLTVAETHFMEEFFKDNPEQQQVYSQAMEESDSDMSVGYTAASMGIEQTSFCEMSEGIFAGMFPSLMLAIFVVLMVCSEYSSGYIKNLSGMVSNRGKLFLAKIPAILLFNLMLMAVNLATLLITFRPVMGYFISGGVGNLLASMGLQFVIYSVFGILIAALASIIRNTAVSMTVGVALTSGLFNLLYAGVNAILHYAFNVSDEFVLSNYTISGTLPQMLHSASNEVLTRGLIVGGVYLILAIAGAYYLGKRRDV